MKTVLLNLLVLILLALTACVGAEKIQDENPTVTAVAEVVESLPTETAVAVPQDNVEPADGAENVEVEPTVRASGEQLASECTLVSSLPEPPQEFAELFSVQDDDWVSGPGDAAITLIEYGDFQ